MSDGLMTEEKSRPSILVIEDSPKFGRNAREGLKGCQVTLVTTLDDAMKALRDGKFDFVLSDVHFPESKSKRPKANVSEMLNLAYKHDIPLCFVTKADHHGMIDLGDEGRVSLMAVTVGDIATTFMDPSVLQKKPDEKDLFRQMKTSARDKIRSSSKTPETWGRALELVRNASANPSPITRAIKKIRGIGLDVAVKNGMAKVVPPRR